MAYADARSSPADTVVIVDIGVTAACGVLVAPPALGRGRQNRAGSRAEANDLSKASKFVTGGTRAFHRRFTPCTSASIQPRIPEPGSSRFSQSRMHVTAVVNPRRHGKAGQCETIMASARSSHRVTGASSPCRYSTVVSRWPASSRRDRNPTGVRPLTMPTKTIRSVIISRSAAKGTRHQPALHREQTRCEAPPARHWRKIIIAGKLFTRNIVVASPDIVLPSSLRP